MATPNFRHELKYAIHAGDYLEIRNRLRLLAHPDEHTGPNGYYTVKSLYFDNADDKALREKVDGVNNREKYRLRYYGGDYTFLRLEQKCKTNGLCRKFSAPLTKEECQKLLEGDWAFLKESADPFLLEFYTKLTTQQLRPRSFIVYDREAYTHPLGNVRITFDRNIRASSSPQHFLADDPPLFSREQPLLMEVKYDAFLPEFLADAVSITSRQPGAFSKYAFGRGV